MSDVNFDLKPVVKKPSRKYRPSRGANGTNLTLVTLSKPEIMELAQLYGNDHPW